MKPTIVLVHGAFAESASWDAVIDPLLDAGHPVIAAANPLRGLAADATSVADVVRAVDGPVVLAAHSYGGAVISNVPADAGEIVGLVYACGFAPEPGESAFSLASMFPAARSATRSGPSRAATAPPTCTSPPSASMSSSAPTCPPRRPRGWPPPSARPRRRHSRSRPASGHSGARCPRGS
jgi:pimeloyl-ACP methyl ester carboxylesterase